VIVVDASVLANALADDGIDGRVARDELRRAEGLAAPDLVDVETVAVLRKRWMAGSIADSRFAAAIDDFLDLELDRYPVLRLMRRAFELRDTVTPYDAAYVALAEGLGVSLVTADEKLSRAPGPVCKIKLLAVQ
jgi:predicted nucleic acid-binding protein